MADAGQDGERGSAAGLDQALVESTAWRGEITGSASPLTIRYGGKVLAIGR